MSDETFFNKPRLGKHSFAHMFQYFIAFLFVMGCVSVLTVFIHTTISENTMTPVNVEYINMIAKDVLNANGKLILKAPDLVIEKFIDFPISYNKFDVQGYILLDTATQVRYLYIRSGNSIGITKYWPMEPKEMREFYDKRGDKWPESLGLKPE